jgi:hypothetical protein
MNGWGIWRCAGDTASPVLGVMCWMSETTKFKLLKNGTPLAEVEVEALPVDDADGMRSGAFGMVANVETNIAKSADNYELVDSAGHHILIVITRIVGKTILFISNVNDWK